MYLKELLKNVDLMKVSNGTIQALNHAEEKNIRIFIDALLDEDNCQAVFRGENIAKAYKQSGACKDIKKNNDEQLAQHGKIIFYIGTKAQSYLYNLNNNEMPFDLNSVEQKVFENIFFEIKSLINTGSVSVYFDSNFSNYFKNKSANEFIAKIDKLHKDEKQHIKVYYLWLLHVIGDSVYKKYSNFLSTTKDHKIAKSFAKNELVYCGWVPRPIKKRAAYLGSLIQLEQRIKTIGLPVYNNEPYPSEHEISLIGGLFPHYTLGIYHLPTKKLIVNTNLLDEASLHMISKGMSEFIINDGIPIDQTGFSSSNELINSKYKRWLSHSEENGFLDHNINT